VKSRSHILVSIFLVQLSLYIPANAIPSISEMTTLVFKPASEGMVQQVQVGAADVIALCSAATSAWGWIGGLNSVRALLERLNVAVRPTVGTVVLNLPPSQYCILTSRGVRFVFDPEQQPAFGGDSTSQLVGSTLCALAHIFEENLAVQLFMRCLAPCLFSEIEKTPELKDAIQTQLFDNLSVIINEGATRGLTERFERATSQLPPGDSEFLKKRNQVTSNTDVNGELAPLPCEADFAAGLLVWAGKVTIRDISRPYFTRSGLAARMAACLKEVGYPLESVSIWNGLGEKPINNHQVVLVTGGTSTTDEFQYSPGEFAEPDVPFYYQKPTIGAMLVESLHYVASTAPETIQTFFVQIRSRLKKSVTCRWSIHRKQDSIVQVLGAAFTFSSTIQPAFERPHSLRLATFYFPRSARLLARYYDDIESEPMVKCVEDHLDAILGYDPLPEMLIQFRTITACIILSLTELLVGPEFSSRRHCTCLNLSSSAWLEHMSHALDTGIQSCIPLWKASILVASVHAGADPQAVQNEKSMASVIGFRHGIFCVVPRILTNMKPTEECLGVACLDKFIGNIPVHSDGWIRSGIAPHFSFKTADNNASYHRDLENLPTHQLTSFGGPSFGSPQNKYPDVPLYLSVERPIHYNSPDVLLCGRIEGKALAYFSVESVLCVVAKSLDVTLACPGHVSSSLVLNTNVSRWVEERFLLCRQTHVYLQVLHDDSWALFAAGQAQWCGGLVMANCFNCVKRAIGKDGGSLIVGWGPVTSNDGKN